MYIIEIIVFWGRNMLCRHEYIYVRGIGICVYCHVSVYRCVWYMCMCVLVSKCVLFACVADDNFEYVLLFAAYDVILINDKPES